MEIRGQRQCQECDTRWSYFETGTVACPACGSLHSVGVDDRRLHTDRPADLDLAPARRAATEGRVREAAATARERTAAYLRHRGFIDGGALRPLDDTVLTIYELREVARILARTMEPTEAAEHYLVTLLSAVDDGDRPDPAEVPVSLHGARGLGTAAAVDEYLHDVRDWIDHREDPVPPAVRSVLGRIREHRRRIEALEGDVSPTDTDRLVRATRAVVSYVQTEEPGDLERANTSLDAIA